MKIITALGNPILNNELKKEKYYEIVSPDIQYQDGVIEILEEKKNIDILILSEILPGELKFYNFINEIIKHNNKIKIIIFLENKKEDVENFLISKGIFDIYYNNEITINEIKNILKEKNNIFINEEKIKKEKIIKYKIKKKSNINNKKECIIISILGSHDSGKSIFSINFAKSIENKKILLIDFDILNNSIHSILGISKIPSKIKNKKIINAKNIIYKLNKNIHIMSGIDLLFPDKITNSEIKKLIFELKPKYDYIIIDTSSECFFDTTRFLIRNSNQCIFLLEGNILEIQKAKKLLNIYLEEWYIDKEKINIVVNKYNRNSINIRNLKNIFCDFKFIGKINYDILYNLLINKGFKNYIAFKKIKKQYKNIINNLPKNNLKNKINLLGGF